MMQYIKPSVRVAHFKQLNRRMWRVAVAMAFGAAILAALFIYPRPLGQSMMKMSFAESVFALNQKFLNDNPKYKKFIYKGE